MQRTLGECDEPPSRGCRACACHSPRARPRCAGTTLRPGSEHSYAVGQQPCPDDHPAVAAKPGERVHRPPSWPARHCRRIGGQKGASEVDRVRGQRRHSLEVRNPGKLTDRVHHRRIVEQRPGGGNGPDPRHRSGRALRIDHSRGDAARTGMRSRIGGPRHEPALRDVVEATNGCCGEGPLRAVREVSQPQGNFAHGPGTSQSERTTRVTSRRSRHRSVTDGRPQNQ